MDISWSLTFCNYCSLYGLYGLYGYAKITRMLKENLQSDPFNSLACFLYKVTELPKHYLENALLVILWNILSFSTFALILVLYCLCHFNECTNWICNNKSWTCLTDPGIQGKFSIFHISVAIIFSQLDAAGLLISNSYLIRDLDLKLFRCSRRKNNMSGGTWLRANNDRVYPSFLKINISRSAFLRAEKPKKTAGPVGGRS